MDKYETWDRDGNGNLIPQKGTVVITDNVLKKEIRVLEFKVSQIKETKEKAVMTRANELLKEALKKTTQTIEIMYTPLLFYQLSFIRKELGCEGEKVPDLDSQVCFLHCTDPKKSLQEWQDMIDPTVKLAISSFIIQASYPKREKHPKEVEAFQMLQ